MKRSPSPYSIRTAEKRSALLEERARTMRSEMTPSEKLLWAELHAGRLGVRFVRQALLGEMIVDFYCPARRLAIEVDGLWHLGREAKDAKRDEKLARLGVRVLRFSNDEVEAELAGVVQRIVIGLA